MDVGLNVPLDGFIDNYMAWKAAAQQLREQLEQAERQVQEAEARAAHQQARADALDREVQRVRERTEYAPAVSPRDLMPEVAVIRDVLDGRPPEP